MKETEIKEKGGQGRYIKRLKERRELRKMEGGDEAVRKRRTRWKARTPKRRKEEGRRGSKGGTKGGKGRVIRAAGNDE